MNPLDTLLRRLDDDRLLELAETTDAVLYERVPQLGCVVKWDLPFYQYIGNWCFLNVEKDYLLLGFINGREATECVEWLHGHDLKRVRHYRIHSENDLYRPEFDMVIEEMMVINERRAKR